MTDLLERLQPPMTAATAIQPLSGEQAVLRDLDRLLSPSVLGWATSFEGHTIAGSRLYGYRDVRGPAETNVKTPWGPSPQRFDPATPISMHAGTARVVLSFFDVKPSEPAALRGFSWERALHAVREDAAQPEVSPASPAYEKFVQVAAWLDLEHGELAQALGVGRTTPYAWKNEGRQPRSGTFRKIRQLHSFCRALVERIGANRATDWFNTGNPTPRELLLDDKLAQAQKLARPLLFDHVRTPRTGAWLPDDDIKSSSRDET